MKPRSARKTDRKKILIVDDHPVLREGLVTVINQQPDLQVCGETAAAAKTMTAVAASRPDAVVIDISLEEGSGLELIKDLHAQYPRLPMLALSLHDETLYAERTLRAGALGYVMKKEPVSTVIAALRKVLSGNFALSEKMTAKIMGTFLHSSKTVPRTPLELLSDRELEVFQRLGRGHSTRQIAEELHLSIKTISCYRQNIKAKLKLKNASELVRHAVSWAQRHQMD